MPATDRAPRASPTARDAAVLAVGSETEVTWTDSRSDRHESRVSRPPLRTDDTWGGNRYEEAPYGPGSEDGSRVWAVLCQIGSRVR